MDQRVLLYTKTLPVKLAVRGALDQANIDPEQVSSPAELLQKLQHGRYDALVIDADSSPIPLPKLLEVIANQVALNKTAVVVLTGSQAQPLPENSEALLYDRPIRPALLLGALNRTLLAAGRQPILRATEVLERDLRRSVRVPLLLPLAWRVAKPGVESEWQDAEARDVSATGAQIATIESVANGQLLEIRNTLTGRQAAFRVVWVGEDTEGVSAGLAGNNEDLHFWIPK